MNYAGIDDINDIFQIVSWSKLASEILYKSLQTLKTVKMLIEMPRGCFRNFKFKLLYGTFSNFKLIIFP